MLVEPKCARCERASSRIELVPPGELPSAWSNWSATSRGVFARHHDPVKWRFLFDGVCGGNGLGDDIDEEEAARIASAFAEPLDVDRISAAGLHDGAGFCQSCRAAYCFEHWGAPATGYGACPMGHGKSLDPHWSPDF